MVETVNYPQMSLRDKHDLRMAKSAFLDHLELLRLGEPRSGIGELNHF
jgi:hypothetical protein